MNQVPTDTRKLSTTTTLLDLDNLRAQSVPRLHRLGFRVEQSGEVAKTLKAVEEKHAASDIEGARIDYARLWFLANDLEALTEAAPAFADAAICSMKAAVGSAYSGLRVEVRAAADLHRAGIPFKKQESPDFLVPVEGGAVWIECTSASLASERADGRDLRYKIDRALRDKNRAYANLRTALAIDITNVVWSATIQSEISEWEADAVRGYLDLASCPNAYGAVILLTTMVTFHSVDTGFTRWFARDIHPELRQVLDRAYPTSKSKPRAFPFVERA